MPLYNAALAPAVPKSVGRTVVRPLTENGGAIGGTNDGDMPAAPSVSLAWDGGTDPSSDDAAAIAAAVTALGGMVREVAQKLNDLIDHLNNGRR